MGAQGQFHQPKARSTSLQTHVASVYGIVWLDNGGGHLWGWVHAESELGLLAVANGKTLQEQGTKAGAGSSSNGVEDHEALETGTLVGELTEAVKSKINNLLA